MWWRAAALTLSSYYHYVDLANYINISSMHKAPEYLAVHMILSRSHLAFIAL
jgi:hypothetical protein